MERSRFWGANCLDRIGWSNDPLRQRRAHIQQLFAGVAFVAVAGCATGHYTPLGEAERDEIEQLRANVYRVEYRVSPFTSQEQLDAYLRRRCAELTVREGFDYFHLAQRADVLALSRRTSITVTMYKGAKPDGPADIYDANQVLAFFRDVRSSHRIEQ